MWWMISFVSWLPIYLLWLMMIVWDGSWQKMETSLSAHIIISYMTLLPLLFLGKIFGKLRHLGVSLSLFGQLLGIGSSREITWVSGVLILLTGALCVVVAMRQWIICCYIAERLIGYGVLFLGLLRFLRFPCVRCKTVCLVGGINLVPLCLMWCIWKERNRRTFEDLDKSKDQLLALFASSLFDWARAWGLTSSDSIPFFLSSLLLCN